MNKNEKYVWTLNVERCTLNAYHSYWFMANSWFQNSQRHEMNYEWKRKWFLLHFGIFRCKSSSDECLNEYWRLTAVALVLWDIVHFSSFVCISIRIRIIHIQKVDTIQLIFTFPFYQPPPPQPSKLNTEHLYTCKWYKVQTVARQKTTKKKSMEWINDAAEAQTSIELSSLLFRIFVALLGKCSMNVWIGVQMNTTMGTASLWRQNRTFGWYSQNDANNVWK